MKTELYEDITTNNLMTFEEVKQEYAKANNSDLPIDNDTMYLIIMESLYQNGGNIKLVNESEDEILKWCNDYSEYNEADRYLSQEERDESVRDIYECISSNGDYLHEEIMTGLKRDKDNEAEAKELLERLERLL